MRDITLEDTFYHDFSTRAFATGIPTVLAGTPVLSVLEENNATPITAGVSVSVDRASVVGLNMATIVATAANGYENGKGYSIYISTGTVGGVSVIGEKVGEFTIGASAAAVDLANGTDGLGAIKTSVDAIPTTAMRGTDNALLAASINLTGGAVDTVTTLTNKTGFSLASTGLDAIVSTATGMVEIAKAIWDRALTGATHNIATSAGRRLRQIQETGAVYNGRVWVDTNNGVAGTIPYENGTSDNHVDLWASAITIAPNVNGGLTDFNIINGSSITLSANSDSYSIFGDGYTLALGGQSCASIFIQGASVSGIGTAATGQMHFDGCAFGIASIQSGHFDFCQFADTVTHTLAGSYTYHSCYSGVAGIGASIFTKTPGQTITAEWRGWAGSITVSGIESGDIMTISGSELGDVVLNGADGTVKILGQYESLTDNRTGSPTLVIGAFEGSDVTDIKTTIGTAGVGLTAVSLAATGLDAIVSTATGAVQLAKAVWDRVISMANHNIGQSAGKILRQSGDLVQIDGAVSDVSPATTGFDTNLTQADGYFDDAVMIFSNGAANAGIGFPVSSYVNANGAVTFDVPDDWPVTPVNGDDFVIYATHVHPVSQIADAVLDEALSGHTTAGTLGKVISDGVPTAAQLAYITANAATGVPVTFTTSGGSTTAAVLNLVDGSSGSATDDQYNGRLLVFTDGTLKDVVTDITDYDGASTTATITAIPFAPTATHNARLI